MHCQDECFVCGGGAEFVVKPVELLLLELAACGDVAVEPDDCCVGCKQSPVDVGLGHGYAWGVLGVGGDFRLCAAEVAGEACE